LYILKLKTRRDFVSKCDQKMLKISVFKLCLVSTSK